MGICAAKGKKLVEFTGRYTWKDNYIIYNKHVPTLKNLSIASIWGHDVQHLLTKKLPKHYISQVSNA
jgi:hypothetical protein